MALPLITLFVYFVAFKVLSTLMFSEPLTVLASAMIAIAAVVIESVAIMQHAATYGRTSARARLLDAAAPSFTRLYLIYFLAALGATIVAGLLIAYGFSTEFWRSAFPRGVFSWRRSTSFFDIGVVKFILLIGLPMAANAAFTVWALSLRHKSQT